MDPERRRRRLVELRVFALQQSMYPPKALVITPEHFKACLRCFLVRPSAMMSLFQAWGVCAAPCYLFHSYCHDCLLVLAGPPSSFACSFPPTNSSRVERAFNQVLSCGLLPPTARALLGGGGGARCGEAVWIPAVHQRVPGR